MFTDYTKLVLQCYEEKRAVAMLSQRLTNPTPAKLKGECMALFSAGTQRKDQAAINTFFEKKSGEDVDLRTIEKHNRDKFRPLWKFITGRINDTDIKNIELLAWLIDFEPRPFVYGKRYGADSLLLDGGNKTDEVESTVGLQSFSGIEQQPQLIKTSQLVTDKKHHASKTKAGIIAIVVLIMASAIAYWLQKNKPEPVALMNIKTGEACMYWVGDHYEQTPCTQKHGDTLVVAVDTLELRHLRKINKPDTITLNAIGRVWYIKTNNQVECFTWGGNYPLDPKRRLRPITKLIIQKYIHPGN